MLDNEGAALSRRQLVGGVGLGIVAAAGPALAQPQIQPTDSEPIMICQSACDLGLLARIPVDLCCACARGFGEGFGACRIALTACAGGKSKTTCAIFQRGGTRSGLIISDKSVVQ
jgi:hypothetical protein